MDRVDTKSRLRSVLLGVYLNAGLLNQVAIKIIPSLGGLVLKGIYLFIIGLLFYDILLSRYIRLKIFQLLLPMVILIYFYGTYFLYDNLMTSSFLYFAIYVIVPFLLIQKIEYRDVIEVIMFTSILVLPVSGSFFILRKSFSDSISMGLTYTLLPTIVCAIIHFIYWRDSIVYYIFYCTNGFFLYRILLHGVRGPIICILISIILLTCTRYDNNEHKIKIRSLPALIIGTLAIVIFSSFEVILLAVKTMLDKLGINFYFISKTLRLLNSSGVDNGRTDIFELSLDEFFKSPIIGRGISMFRHYTGVVYPHNFILQLLCDGGIILTLVVMGVFIYHTIIFLLRCDDKEQYIFWIMLISVSIPAALFSGDLWENYRFWVYMAFIVSRSFLLSDNEKP